MANKELERRSYNFEVRAEENEQGSIITGRPIVYNSRTDIGFFDEIIEQGALNDTDLTDVRFMVNHDMSKIPLARSRRNNGNSTMQLTVDEQGMSIRVLLDTVNNAEAKSLFSAVQRGDITGMSFAFGVSDEEWEDLEKEHPLRRIKGISTVVEVSAVTFPAYEATEIYARSKEALDSARSALERVRQQTAEAVETDSQEEARGELELAKAKFTFRSRL
jgi:HK97 family phage prohead protease